MVDASLTTPWWFVPRLRRLNIREQVLLQIVVITLIAFSVSFFSVWELRQIRDSFDKVMNSLRPAKSALQLAKELEHIYGLSEAYQLSFNQPEQRQAIFAEIEKAKENLDTNQKDVVSYSGPDVAAGIRSFLGSVEDSRRTSDRFTIRNVSARRSPALS